MQQNNNNEKKSFKQFDKRLLKQAVQDVEDGTPRSEVQQRYGISKVSLQKWMNRLGSPSYRSTKRRVISTLTKRSAVLAIESGKLTIAQAAVAYNVKDAGSIRGWIAAFKEQSTDPEVVNCVDMSKKQHIKTPLEQENERLKKALEYAELKLLAVNTLIDVAEDQFKISIRKKPGAKQ